MLSRLARAPRLGLTAARLSRPLATPILRTRPAPISASPWIRAYSKDKNGVDQSPFDQNKPSHPNASEPASSTPDSAKSHDPSSASAEAAEENVRKAEDGTSPDASKDAEQIPFDKLPDLTQGIPSTLLYELDQKAGKSGSSLTAVDEEEAGRETREQYVSTSDRNRKWWTRFMLIFSAAGSVVGIMYQGRDWDAIESERHADIPNGGGLDAWWKRAKARMTESVTYYQEPAFEKLLPDPDPSFERPYTLCISLDNLLVHSEWTRDHGWRVAKRPGVDYFIRYLSQYYELVLFTSVPFATADPLVKKLDPFHFIMWPLYREATKYEDGEIVKDLSYLNRDLSKVIIIDTEAKHVRNQPENAIIIDPWKGDSNDKDLVALIPFLEYIHTMQYNDVRKVLKSFDGKHIPTEFARREAIARREFEARRLAEKSKHRHGSGMGALGSMIGLKPSNMSMMMPADGELSPSEAFAQGKMLQDLARERGQRQYQMIEKEIRENGDKWLKEEEAMMEKAQQEAMSSMMQGFGGWFTPKDGGEKKS